MAQPLISQLTAREQRVLFARVGETLTHLQEEALSLGIWFVFHNERIWMHYNDAWIKMDWKQE